MSELINNIPKKRVDSFCSNVYEYGNNSCSPSNFLLEPTANILNKRAAFSLISRRLIEKFLNQDISNLPSSHINQPKVVHSELILIFYFTIDEHHLFLL